ncbi:MAG TPA: small basic family protein [Clostridia bacterium]|jgi:small basic protein|nr:small basic family protein [Clostridia bacterium]
MWIPFVGLIVGVLIGLIVPLQIPAIYSRYLSVGVLAALDSVFGAVRASQEENFDSTIFVSGFFTNTLLAAGLTFLGDRLGVELYNAALLVFGMRLFQNLAFIRRHIISRRKPPNQEREK